MDQETVEGDQHHTGVKGLVLQLVLPDEQDHQGKLGDHAQSAQHLGSVNAADLRQSICKALL